MRNVRRVVVGAAAMGAMALATLAGPAGASTSTTRDAGPLKLVVPPSTFHLAQSTNWSGYNQGEIEKGHLFTSISGTYVVPTATPHKANEAEASASWIGIGGGCLDTNCTSGDNTLVQAGTGQDIAASGKKSYYAWYELIPAPETRVSLPVAPGNRINITIKQTASKSWSIAIRNLSTGKTFSKTVQYSSTMGSAEWIEETPTIISSSGTRLAKLPKLSRVHFTQATANGAPAGFKPAERIQLVGSNGQVLATPSTPGSPATAFNDCTYASSCPAP
jgi:hypothetical protein